MFSERSGIQKLLFLKAALAGGGSAIERTAIGNPLTFQTDLARPLKSLLIPFSHRQSGTGDPSPQNIRPIVAWDGLTVFGGGKNLFSNSGLTYGKWILGTGEVQKKAERGAITAEIPVISGERYTFSCNGTAFPLSIEVIELNANKGFIKRNYSTIESTSPVAPQDVSFIATANTKYLICGVFCVEKSTITSENVVSYMMQLEMGTKTDYVPCSITETDISFPSPVYGGTLDVVSGVLTVTHGVIGKTWGDFSNKTSLGDNTRGTFNISSYPSKPSSEAVDAKCNIAPRGTGWSTDSIHFYTNEGSCVVFLPNDTDASTEIQVVYPLVTPQEIQLTPAQITALLGNNTIWSDADGSMTCVYLVSSKYAEEHPISGGLGSGLLGGGFGSGSSDPGEDQPEDPEGGE